MPIEAIEKGADKTPERRHRSLLADAVDDHDGLRRSIGSRPHACDDMMRPRCGVARSGEDYSKGASNASPEMRTGDKPGNDGRHWAVHSPSWPNDLRC